MELFSINEISKIYSIPKSTLRYWEEKGLIQPERNQENDYRMYDLKELIHIGDIVFYRNLGFSINQLKSYREMSGAQLDDLLTNAQREVEDELAKLEVIQQVIQDRKEKLSEIKQLSETDYLVANPDFDFLVPYSYEDPLNYASFQENNPSNFTLYLTFKPQMYVQESLIISKKTKEQPLIWEKKATMQFRQVLLKIPADVPIDPSIIAEHTTQLRQLGYQTKAIIARYLGTTKDNQQRFEYYKAWFEVEKKAKDL